MVRSTMNTLFPGSCATTCSSLLVICQPSRKFDREPQRRVQEHVAAHHAGIRIVAKDDAVDVREIAVAIDDPRALAAGAHLLDRHAHALCAILWLRVRRHPVRHAVAIRRFRNPRERRQKRGHLVRVPAVRGGVLGAQRICLQLGVSPEFEEQHARAHPERDR